jgi:hypothetical protein
MVFQYLYLIKLIVIDTVIIPWTIKAQNLQHVMVMVVIGLAEKTQHHSL